MAAWYDTNWPYRIPVTVDNTGNATSALSYYQAGVRLSGAAYTSFHAHAKADGSDVVVTDSDGTTTLDFALEGIDAVNSTADLLIKVSCAADATRTIYVYYGNAGASSASSYATAVGPRTNPAASVDIYNQANFAGFNAYGSPTRLRHQDQAHGGGAGLNGTILCPFMAGSGNAETDGSIRLATSTDGGATWTTAALGTPAASHTYDLRGFGELADGTLALVAEYGGDSPGNGLNPLYVWKSVDGGSTWAFNGGTAASTLPNPPGTTGSIAVPWTVGTNSGTGYGPVVQAANGDLLYGVYGVLTGDSGWHVWLMRCASGSDPSVGSNWSTQGIVANGAASGDATGNHYSEMAFANTSGNSFTAVMRNDTVGDLYTTTFTSSGASFTPGATPSRLNIPGASSGGATSPFVLPLASGNLLLLWVARYGVTVGGTASYAVLGAVSTDGGATWRDRQFAVVASAAQTGSHSSAAWTNPWAAQNADGTVVATYGYGAGAGSDIANFAAVHAITEDWLCNQANAYDPVTSVASNWAVSGASTATIDAGRGHANGSSLKLDNSVGSGTLPSAVRSNLWAGVATNLQPARGAWSVWCYLSQVSASPVEGVVVSRLIDSNAVNRMQAAAIAPSPYNINWYDGTSEHDTGAATPLGRWHRYTFAVDLGQSPLRATIGADYAIAAGPGNLQWTTGTGAPSQVSFTGGTGTQTTATTWWVADLYAQQYTPALPASSVGAEQTQIVAHRLTLLGCGN